MRIEHIKRHLSEQQVISELISEAYGGLIRIGRENVSPQRVETYLEKLAEEWRKFRMNNVAIRIAIDLLSNDDRQSIESTLYFSQNLYASTQDRYFETVEKMKQLLNRPQELFISTPAIGSQPISTPTALTVTPRIYQDPRLPRINLPNFSGEYDEWLTFKELFSSIVVSNQLISDTEKHQYLKSCLKGTAAQLFKTATSGEDEFHQTWTALKNFYDSRRILVSVTLDSFFNIKEVKQENSKELERLYTSTTHVYRTLKNLKRPVEHWDDILVHIIVRQKLDANSIRSWEQHIGSSDEPPTWEKLQSFLISRSRTLRAIENSQGKNLVSPNHFKKPAVKSYFTSQPRDNTRTMSDSACGLCHESHYIARCPKYMIMTPKKRNELISELKLCYNCLRPHRLIKCTSTFRCFKCGKRHHSSLHQDGILQQQRKSYSATPKQVNHVNQVQSSSTLRTIILLATARLKVVNDQGESVIIRALLDQGSEITLIFENLVQQLRLRRKHSSVPILGIDAHHLGRTKGIVSFIIRSHFESNLNLKIDAHVLSRLTSLTPSARISTSTCPHIETLLLADPDLSEPGKIDLILGSNIYGYLLDGPIKKGPRDSPIAQQTKLGWIISGPSQSIEDHQGISIHHCSIDHELHSLLEQFWHQEEVKPTKTHVLSLKDEECENHFVETHQRDITGRYIVRLPFKEKLDSIGDSKHSALRMLHHLFHKFEEDSTLFDAYSSFLKEYEELHHMNRVKSHLNSRVAFYLPHHEVIRESSSTTKLRVVFNGSCRVSGGINLNEALHIGPKCQSDLFDVLVWMRTFKYIYSSDIEKMYRQILVHPDDRKHQRILWREGNQIVEFELATVTYGLACAPFLALRSVFQLIKDEGSKYPGAIDVLLKGRYVDDIFGGSDTIEKARHQAKEVNDLCMAGGFPLRKWISNNPDVLKHINPDFRIKTEAIPIKDQVVHALALSWNPSLDIFQFKLIHKSSSLITKRLVLSRIAQFFDPLGFLSPLFIKSKIFMQELWAMKLSWDEPLPSAQQQTWRTLVESLEGLEIIQIQRWMGTTCATSVEIHGFSDASQLAMAAVIYLRTSNNNCVQTVLLCSKTKVAPLKRMTIPRLELSAAVLLTKLTQNCIKVLNLPTLPCYLWTDSSIVHIWINNHPSRWKEFVHNRVCMIQEALPDAQWKHVPGAENPADCATRGVSSAELQKYSLWWEGPPWLTSPSWPSNCSSSHRVLAKDLEERPPLPTLVLHTVKEKIKWEIYYRYSSLSQLLRITARVMRAIKTKSLKALAGPITPDDISNARQFWIRKVQLQHLLHEMNTLSKNKELPKSTSIIRLLPFIDDQGLLRVGGRLKNSLLPSTAKHPYILPEQSTLSTLIIQDAHHRTLHGSTQETLLYTRNSCWILGGRRPVRSFILKCVTCTRYRRNHAQHIMGQLPKERVTPSRAFLHTGVDYAGPISIKTWKGKAARSYKAWIALFVCLSTSAIHLEIVTDYSSESFLAAYKRFTARRGICASLVSDCGTNFKGADKELKKLFHKTSTELQHLGSAISLDGTIWNFIPPASPHFGGKWEAGVKSMKYHLRRVIGDKLLTYEEISTVLNQIEAILNSRPLSTLTDDPEDLEVLTPRHFLIGQSLTLPPEPNLLQIQSSRLSRWQHLCQIMQSFWNKWSREYLQRHQSVYKWNKPSPPLTEGSLVFIMDERYPPAKWPLGRVTKLHYGKDGIARIADLKTSSHLITRPIVKLCPLKLTNNCSSAESTKAGGKC